MAKPYFNLLPSTTQTQLKIDITSECLHALRIGPKERSESDIKLIMELIGNFPQINQAPALIKREVCKLGTYMKLDEKSTVYSSGDPADSIYIILKGLIQEKMSKDPYGDYEGSTYSIGDGTIIGEQMILLNKMHSATAVAMEETDVLRLSLEDYAQIRRSHEIDIRDKLEILTNISVFKAYDTSELLPLCDALIHKRYIPNKVIVEQGSEPIGVYFIKSGKCKMVKEMDVKRMPSPKKSTVYQNAPTSPVKKSSQKKVDSPSSSPSTSKSSKPVQSGSNSSIGPSTIIHPFLASRLDPNYSVNNTSSLSSSPAGSPSSFHASSPPKSSAKHSPTTTRKSSTPTTSTSTTSTSTTSNISSPISPSSTSDPNIINSSRSPKSDHKPETEKKFLEVGPLLPYEYFGEKAIIENRSGVEISVLSETHVELYYLPKIDFHRHINSKTISFMKKNSGNYPSDKEILAQYYKQQEWEHYKSNLVQDILNDKANRNMGSMFARTR